MHPGEEVVWIDLRPTFAVELAPLSVYRGVALSGKANVGIKADKHHIPTLVSAHAMGREIELS